MSGRLWAYSSEKCDGEYCPGDCDRCYKADWSEDETHEDDVDNTR